MRTCLTNDLESSDTFMQKKVQAILYIICKNYFKMDHRFKCKTKIIKLLEDNTGENIHDLELGKDFLDVTPKE